MMIRKTIKFSLLLLVILLLAFGIQQIFLHLYGQDWNSHLIVPAYIVNFILVMISYLVILKYLKSQNFSIGFIFMGGFLLKMMVYVIFFNPEYRSNGSIETIEFFSFFTPYSICLIFETYSLVRLLNKS